MHTTVLRRFHRVAPPAENSTVQTVQVDHSRKGLLIGGKPWVGQGWYMSPWNQSLELLSDAIRDELAPHGINQGMVYGPHPHLDPRPDPKFATKA